MSKYISLLLVFVFTFTLFGNVSAMSWKRQNEYYKIVKRGIITKVVLQKTASWRKNVDFVHRITKSYSIQEAQNVLNKIKKLSTSTRNSKKYKDLLDYLEISFTLKIFEK